MFFDILLKTTDIFSLLQLSFCYWLIDVLVHVFFGGTSGVTVIFVGNGNDELNSNLG